MNELIVLVALIYTTLYGYGVLNNFVFFQKNDLLSLPMSFGVGFGLISYQMFLYSIVGIDWSPLSLLLPQGVLLVLLTLHARMSLKIPRFEIRNKLTMLLMVLIFSLTLFVFFEGALRPLSSWDGWASWQMKAKVYYMDGHITQESFTYLHTEYPIVVPLYSTFIYEMLGDIDDTAILWISSFFYMMIGLLLFAILRSRTSVRYALVITFLVLSTQNLIRHGGRYEAGLADIILAFFILSCLVLVKLYSEKKDNKVLAPLFIILGITSQIKNEGIIFSLILFTVIALYLIKARLLRETYKAIFFLVPLVGWFVFKRLYQLPQGILSSVPIADTWVLKDLLVIEMKQYLNIQNWNLGWIYFLAGFISAGIMKKVNVCYLLIVMQMSIYLVVFLFSEVDPLTHASGIMDRLALHLYPASIFVASLTIYDILKGSKVSKIIA